jgi:hypothetical protein
LQRVRDLSPDERMAGGDFQAGLGKGVGLVGIGLLGGPTRAAAAVERAHAKPNPGKVVVRWESALPVRTAEQKLGDTQAPEVEGGYYAIAVYDIPFVKRLNLATELKDAAWLKRDKQKDLKPSRVVILPKEDGRGTVVYLFRSSVEITKRDGNVQFLAQIDRLIVAQLFSTQEMQIQGKLEL